MSNEQQTTIDALAEAAVAPVQSGMYVGLGTGRTATRGIHALARRVKEEKLDVKCVPTSEASERLGKELGLKIVDFSLLERIDYLFDGADEVDRELRMLKGAGGAMTRERIVAWGSDRCVYMVDQSKIVPRLGTRNTLGVAIMMFGMAAARAEIRSLGLNGVWRRTIQGELFVTDNGNLILDVTLDDRNLEELAAALNDIPGVIDHGLFLGEADEILVDTGSSVDRYRREESQI
ncbi:MAG: ribose-5-phosphate isomerase RpiA [Phycisphaeraceae bacterium]|nr:ribose-5-phosphate isomerase RpiA [Phycisphaeraceae bacterium]MCW5768040.1 ribose-5-phosphate isomerase RpiA [Phycisphaeraceae bacterium]